ncbi:MAG: hypothetical protein HRU19_24120 [Pseudobacteriovorax sp.]|nr:hypothetical protein [Pseudobacteriovorax sp.]
MSADDITRTLVDYVRQHQNPDQALIPQNIPQGILDILLTDAEAKSQESASGNYLSTAVLLILSQKQGSSKIDVTKSTLATSISHYTQAIYLESLQRKGIIKDLLPERNLENILDRVKASYGLTELGKRLVKESSDSTPSYLTNDSDTVFEVH